MHGLGSWGCLTAVSGRWEGVWLGTRGGSRPQERLRSSAEQLIFPEKLKPTLFILHSADASTEETTGISFVGEFGPRAPSPPLPHSLVGERQDFSHCHQLQQTPNRRNATRSPGDNRMKWLDSEWAAGCQPVLCVWVACFVTRVFGFGVPRPQRRSGPATLVMESWVVTSVIDNTHLANSALSQTHVRS